eukprot:2045728-Prymnesium_polylepis.1
MGLAPRVNAIKAALGKRSIWGSSPDPYDSAGAAGDLGITFPVATLLLKWIFGYVAIPDRETTG